MRRLFTETFAKKTRAEWTEIFSSMSKTVIRVTVFSLILCLSLSLSAELDACVEPVLEMEEASNHPHNKYVGNLLFLCVRSRREKFLLFERFGTRLLTTQ